MTIKKVSFRESICENRESICEKIYRVFSRCLSIKPFTRKSTLNILNSDEYIMSKDHLWS